VTSPRRVGAETSETRATLLDRAEQLMLDEGYAAVTYRHLASSAGVTAPLVQYYFPTIDDLFVALLRRRWERNLDKLKDALADQPDTPLRVIWKFSADETSAALMIEFMALGNHRKSIRREIAKVNARQRTVQLDALTRTRVNRDLVGDQTPNAAIIFLLSGIPKTMLMVSDLGVSTGHAETLELVKRYLDWTEPLEKTSSAKAFTSKKPKTAATQGRPRPAKRRVQG
jgi:TetR/AcrR family transcriptional regulator, transcriptional repressor for nem operon